MQPGLAGRGDRLIAIGPTCRSIPAADIASSRLSVSVKAGQVLTETDTC
jgi:hypothetical protein